MIAEASSAIAQASERTASLVPAYEPTARLRHYPKVLQLGEPRLDGFLNGVNVVVQEKLDGSQVRFGKLEDGTLKCGSHRVDFDPTPATGYFKPFYDYVHNELADLIAPGETYFAELVATQQHNTIAYGRTPKHGLYLFDALLGDDGWAEPAELLRLACNLDIDPPNLLASGPQTKDDLGKLIGTESYLGGAIMEGVVVKNYDFLITGPESPIPRPAFGKYVRASFKEENAATWAANKDIVSQIVAKYRTDARYEKAAQHVKDGPGGLEGNMRDLAKLIPELETDFELECRGAIEAMLYDRFRRDIVRGVVKGMPEWYRAKLLGNAA